MIYHPEKGAMWDPSILWYRGKYYAFMMYNRDGDHGLEAGHCLLAVSEDGVHWRDEAVVLEERERERGCKFFKCMVARCGDRFIMDHGVARPEGQVRLEAKDGPDLRLPGFGVERAGGMEVAMVGDGQAVHSEAGNPFD